MKTKSKSRRAFLLAAGAGSAGAVAAVVVAGRKAEGHRAEKVMAAKEDGYRASEHIQKYYKTTEV
jgi:hypothetical protein